MSVHSLMRSIAFAGAVAVASGALADGPGPRGSVKDAPVAAPFSWTGAYIGANLGAAQLRDSAWTGATADPTSAAAFAPCAAAGACPLNRPGDTQLGAIGGIQLGYNLQMQSLVAGVEVDMQGSTANASRSIFTSVVGFTPGTHNANTSLDWLSTVRGRLGVLVSPSMLVYVTGGWAFGHVERTYGAFAVDNATRYAGRATTINSGWTAGAGLEWAIANRVTFGAEYLFVNLDGDRFLSAVAPGPANVCNVTNCNVNVRAGDLETHIARVKVNFKM